MSKSAQGSSKQFDVGHENVLLTGDNSIGLCSHAISSRRNRHRLLLSRRSLNEEGPNRRCSRPWVSPS